MATPTIQTTGRNRWPQVVGGVFRMVVWAVCGVLAVVAMIMIQRAPQVRAEIERQQVAEIAAENRTYCEKWGMRAGTREHAGCTLDLDEIRARHAKRVLDASGVLISEWGRDEEGLR
jgi:hypothetical protein